VSQSNTARHFISRRTQKTASHSNYSKSLPLQRVIYSLQWVTLITARHFISRRTLKTARHSNYSKSLSLQRVIFLSQWVTQKSLRWPQTPKLWGHLPTYFHKRLFHGKAAEGLDWATSKHALFTHFQGQLLTCNFIKFEQLALNKSWDHKLPEHALKFIYFALRTDQQN
jgi:hypothetical protein